MKYCRFLLDDQTHYGAVEDRGGELWIVDLARAPEEDLAFRLEHGHFDLRGERGQGHLRDHLDRVSSAFNGNV